MRITTRKQVNAARMQQIVRATAELPRQAVLMRGRVLVGVMRTLSSPHYGARMADTLKKNSPGIKALKQRISYSIAGVASPADIVPYGRPAQYGNRVMAQSLATGKLLRPREFRGNFGFVAVQSTRGRKGKGIVPLADPAAVYARARLRSTRRGAQYYGPAPRGIHYVTANKLAAFVRKQQRRAGKYLSGWAPAARFFFAPKGISAGYFAEHGRPGSARLTGSAGKAVATVSNQAAYSSGQADRHQAAFRSHGRRMAGSALAKVSEQIRKWYRQQTKNRNRGR